MTSWQVRMHDRKFRMIGAVLSIALMTGTITSCVKPTAPDDVSDATISMSRSLCDGECPDYSVTIHGDGRVEYEGRMWVEVMGRQEYRIEESEVADLVAEFYAIDYFSLDDEYTEPITDTPTTTTSISVDGLSKSISNYFGAPKDLIDLESKIDDVAQTSLWIDQD